MRLSGISRRLLPASSASIPFTVSRIIAPLRGIHRATGNAASTSCDVSQCRRQCRILSPTTHWKLATLWQRLSGVDGRPSLTCWKRNHGRANHAAKRAEPRVPRRERIHAITRAFAQRSIDRLYARACRNSRMVRSRSPISTKGRASRYIFHHPRRRPGGRRTPDGGADRYSDQGRYHPFSRAARIGSAAGRRAHRCRRSRADARAGECPCARPRHAGQRLGRRPLGSSFSSTACQA
jgi:hypothetical protein